jgi:hypothetical protein
MVTLALEQGTRLRQRRFLVRNFRISLRNAFWSSLKSKFIFVSTHSSKAQTTAAARPPSGSTAATFHRLAAGGARPSTRSAPLSPITTDAAFVFPTPDAA